MTFRAIFTAVQTGRPFFIQVGGERQHIGQPSVLSMVFPSVTHRYTKSSLAMLTPEDIILLSLIPETLPLPADLSRASKVTENFDVGSG